MKYGWKNVKNNVKYGWKMYQREKADAKTKN